MANTYSIHTAKRQNVSAKNKSRGDWNALLVKSTHQIKLVMTMTSNYHYQPAINLQHYFPALLPKPYSQTQFQGQQKTKKKKHVYFKNLYFYGAIVKILI